MPNPAVISVEGLSKQYVIGALQQERTFRELLVDLIRRPSHRNPARSIWALRDVNFEIGEGEVVGIVGRNGAGKSTLLKVLSRITHPTTGRARVFGRVASLLEVGTGFHEELTGRENIFLNGSILGMRKKEVEQRFDAIVEFAGVAPFIDTPIKRYSSGMRLRLGFAVAAHLDPDILIVDEVLAVGDAGFQKKCLKAMDGLRSGGRTVLFVSHNLAAVENLCSRGIWIEQGRVRQDGPAREVVENYLASFAGDPGSGSDIAAIESRLGSGEIRYTRLEFLNPDRTPRANPRAGEPLVMRFHYRAHAPVNHPSIGFRLYTDMGTLVTETSTSHHHKEINRIEPGDGCIDLELDLLNLFPGQYSLSLWITGRGGAPVYDGDVRVMLEVDVADVYGSGRVMTTQNGIVYFPQRWGLPTSVPGAKSQP